MSPRYLLPCPHCDCRFEIVAKQAGQHLACPECQATLDAPKLGQIRQLETVGQTELKSGPAPARGAGLKNILFVVGLALTILAGAAGGGLYSYGSQMIVDYDVEQAMDRFDEFADRLSPAHVVIEYERLGVEQGLGEWREQTYVRYSRQGHILKKFSFGLLGLAGVGLVVLLSSFFVRR